MQDDSGSDYKSCEEVKDKDKSGDQIESHSSEGTPKQEKKSGAGSEPAKKPDMEEIEREAEG